MVIIIVSPTKELAVTRTGTTHGARIVSAAKIYDHVRAVESDNGAASSSAMQVIKPLNECITIMFRASAQRASAAGIYEMPSLRGFPRLILWRDAVSSVVYFVNGIHLRPHPAVIRSIIRRGPAPERSDFD
ncbi:unnamed protein product, partial [Iphiclides podalirius]